MKKKNRTKKFLLIGFAAVLLILAALSAIIAYKTLRFHPETHTPIQTMPQHLPYGQPAQGGNLLNPGGMTLATRVMPPAGFFRRETTGYGEYIRSLPVLEDGSPVLLYNGTEKKKNEVYCAVLNVDVGNQNLQQCADSALRLRCEYLYAAGQGDEVAFHLTNGFLFPYSKYREGYRLAAFGNISFLVKLAKPEDSYAVFSEYMDRLFSYAGTLSLSRESTPVNEEDMQIGDFFVQGGTPGHLVMVADICENSRGEKMFLLMQGYTPAQQIHILNNPNANTPWYSLDDLQYPLETPEYTFSENTLMRML